MGRQAPEGLLGIHLNLLVTVLAGHLPAESEEERAAAEQLATFRRERLRLLPGDGHAAADDRLRPAGFTRRPGRLAARPRHGQLLQDLPRLRRRRARGQSHPGPHRRQHHAVLADRHRRLGGPVVLGGTDEPWLKQRVRPGSSGGLGSGRLHHVPRRDLAAPRSWVEKAYPNLTYFNEVDKGGHFAAWEEPELFSEEVREAFRSLR